MRIALVVENAEDAELLQCAAVCVSWMEARARRRAATLPMTVEKTKHALEGVRVVKDPGGITIHGVGPADAEGDYQQNTQWISDIEWGRAFSRKAIAQHVALQVCAVRGLGALLTRVVEAILDETRADVWVGLEAPEGEGR